MPGLPLNEAHFQQSFSTVIKEKSREKSNEESAIDFNEILTSGGRGDYVPSLQPVESMKT